MANPGKKTSRKRPKAQQAVSSASLRRKKESGPLAKNILLIGNSLSAKSLYRSMSSQISLEIIACDNTSEAIKISGQDTVCSVIVSPLNDQSLKNACMQITTNSLLGSVPLYVLCEPDSKRSTISLLYSIGAAAVYEYPKDKKIFIRTIISNFCSLAPTPKTGLKTDKGIEIILNKKLKAEEAILGSSLKLAVSDGVVYVSGTLDRLWKKRYLKKMLAEQAGVVALVFSGLAITGLCDSDRSIVSNAKKLTRISSDIDLKSLRISCVDGKLSLKGSTDDAIELQRLEQLMAELKGVKEVQALVAISGKQAKRDRGIAGRAKSLLTSTFPKLKLSATVYGEVLVIEGRVKTLGQAIKVSEAAKTIVGITKVVNKVIVK